MTSTPDDDPAALDAYVDAAARFMSLTITPEWRPGVVAHLTAIKAAAELVMALPLDDEIEAAAIFVP